MIQQMYIVESIKNTNISLTHPKKLGGSGW